MMECYVHSSMLFWLQSGKVDCWEFNQGFEKSDLGGLYPEENSQGAARHLKSPRAPSKISHPVGQPVDMHGPFLSCRTLLLLH